MSRAVWSRGALFGMSGLLVLLVGGAVWMQQNRAAAVEALRRWASARQALQQVEPAAHDFRAVVTLQAENRQAETAVRAAAAELYGTEEYDEAIPAVPRDRAESYFQLVRCRESLTALAQAGKVHLKPIESFGFASYAESAPEEELIEPVHRQRCAVERVVRLLINVGPSAIVEVQRERPEASGAPTERRTEVAADFFRCDSVWRAAAAVQRGAAIRVVFEGETAHLREFLNRLAEQRPPLVTLAVEVEPGEQPVSVAPTGSPALHLQPVAPTRARFAVVIEVLDSPAAHAVRTAATLIRPER